MLAAHFERVGTDPNLSVAMYAIDSLKQLSIKFLQKEELSNFNFQRVFLKPFETIMVQAESAEICDLVLRCIDMMVLACTSNIRSGWRTIFNIFEVCSEHKTAEVSNLPSGSSSASWRKLAGLPLPERCRGTHMNCLVSFVEAASTRD